MVFIAIASLNAKATAIVSSSGKVISLKEQVAFQKLRELAGSDKESFCQQGINFAGFVVTSIRSGSGIHCNNPLAAAIAIDVCQVEDGFADSHCFVAAKKTLDLPNGHSLHDAKNDVSRALAFLKSGLETKDFISMCRIVAAIWPEKEAACKEIVKPVLEEASPPPGAAPPAKSWAEQGGHLDVKAPRSLE